MSTRLPWFKLYPADFINHTVGLTKKELGIYVTLLMYSWTSGPIPNDPAVIKSIVGTGFEAVIARFFRATPDGLVAPFLQDRRAEYDAAVESKSRAGKASAAKRKQLRSTPVEHRSNNDELSQKSEAEVRSHMSDATSQTADGKQQMANQRRGIPPPIGPVTFKHAV